MHHDLDRSLITDPDPDHPKGTPEEVLPKSSMGQRKLESIPAPEIVGYNLDIANPVRRILLT